jgi:WD40 repeat protein
MAKRTLRFPTWRNLPDGARIAALQFSDADSNLLAATCWVRYDHPEVAWFDLRRDAVVDSTFGANRGEDIGTPPLPAISPDLRFLVRMANEKGGETPCLEFVDRDETKPDKRVRELTAWPYTEYYGDPEGFSSQYFVWLGFAPDGRHLMAVVTSVDTDEERTHAADPGVYRWDVGAILKGRGGARSRGRLLPDAGFFIGIDEPDTVANFPRSVALSPGGTWLAGGFWDGRIPVWALPSGRQIAEAKFKKRKVPLTWRLAISGDGRVIAVADKAITLCDAVTGEPRVTLPPGPKVRLSWLPGSGPAVVDHAFHPAEPLLATACGDSAVRWCDGTTGAELGKFDWGIGQVTAVTFSPDGRLCAAAGQDGQVAIWDVKG